MTNCPNCGAVITGDKCEYCGTVFNNKNHQNLSQIENQLKYAFIRLAQEEQTEFIKINCDDIIVERDMNGRLRPIKFF